MNTTKAFAKEVVRTPRHVLTIMIVVSLSYASVAGARHTITILDDAVLWLLLVLLMSAVYFQWDFVLGALENVEKEVVWRIPTSAQRAALTIDDVPLLNERSSLGEILDILKEHNVHATLFVMSGFDCDHDDGGPEAAVREEYRQLLKRAVDEGHELANHMKFDRPGFAMSNDDFDEAFWHCDTLLARFSGVNAWRRRPKRWFRPASAIWTKHMLAKAREKGYTTVIASVYPHDVAAATRHINATYLTSRVRPGSVVVVHDRWHTPDTLRRAIPRILKSGFQLGTLSDLHVSSQKEPAPRSTLMRKSSFWQMKKNWKTYSRPEILESPAGQDVLDSPDGRAKAE